MSNDESKALVCAVALIQPAVLLWVVIRRRGMRPVLIVNLLFAVGILAFVVPYLPQELASIRAGEATELFDYKNAILTAFETATLLASAFALRGALFAEIIAWFGFAGNFALSLLAMLFVLTFEFKCCGYL
jgi:hypothetical protein